MSSIDLGDFVFERANPEPLRLRVVDREHRPMAYVHVVAEQQGLRRAYGQANQYGEVALAGLATGEIGFVVRDTSFDPLVIFAYDSAERELVVLP